VLLFLQLRYFTHLQFGFLERVALFEVRKLQNIFAIVSTDITSKYKEAPFHAVLLL
jgi:hypothetical protein